MPNEYRERILEIFWPAKMSRWSKLCAVLDCARDERIFRAVESCRLDKSCLYAGRIPWVLQRAAPHLVVLEPEDRFTRFLLDEGWGDSWGIFLRTELPMLDVRRHLRTLLRVKDETGRKLIFRWYDPRVLRIYLPTCQAGELHTVFGPVQSFYCEASTPSELLAYHFDDNQLLTRQHDLTKEQAAGAKAI